MSWRFQPDCEHKLEIRESDNKIEFRCISCARGFREYFDKSGKKLVMRFPLGYKPLIHTEPQWQHEDFGDRFQLNNGLVSTAQTGRNTFRHATWEELKIIAPFAALLPDWPKAIEATSAYLGELLEKAKKVAEEENNQLQLPFNIWETLLLHLGATAEDLHRGWIIDEDPRRELAAMMALRRRTDMAHAPRHDPRIKLQPNRDSSTAGKLFDWD